MTCNCSGWAASCSKETRLCVRLTECVHTCGICVCSGLVLGIPQSVAMATLRSTSAPKSKDRMNRELTHGGGGSDLSRGMQPIPTELPLQDVNNHHTLWHRNAKQPTGCVWKVWKVICEWQTDMTSLRGTKHVMSVLHFCACSCWQHLHD